MASRRMRSCSILGSGTRPATTLFARLSHSPAGLQTRNDTSPNLAKRAGSIYPGSKGYLPGMPTGACSGIRSSAAPSAHWSRNTISSRRLVDSCDQCVSHPLSAVRYPIRPNSTASASRVSVNVFRSISLCARVHRPTMKSTATPPNSQSGTDTLALSSRSDVRMTSAPKAGPIYFGVDGFVRVVCPKLQMRFTQADDSASYSG